MSTVVKEPMQPIQRTILGVKQIKRDQHHTNGNGIPEQSEVLAQIIEPEPKSKAGLRVSEADYWETYYRDLDFNYEWNNGILEEKPVSSARGIDQYSWAGRAADMFVEIYPVARVMRLEMGVRIPLEDKTTIRKPDLFVVRHDNPVPLHDNDRSYTGTCDLCMEALSSSKQSEVTRDTTTKRNEYEEVGIREYYILDPEGEHTAFYYQNEVGKYEEIPVGEDGIMRSRVLPGFQLRVNDLYRLPTLLEMAEDEVYRHFAMPAYRRATERAEQERLRAEQAETRAEQERRRAEEADARAEQERVRAEQERVARSEADARAEQERVRAEQERVRAEQERVRAEQERVARSKADARAEAERLARSEAEAKLAEVMARLRTLDIQLG